ncbi:MAG: hypothetical protein ACYDA1_10260 [Vulcanimicrobiaceae bacterium]
MSMQLFDRDFFTGFFVLFGVYLAARPACFAQVCPLFRAVIVPDQALAERLRSAQMRRKDAEGISLQLGWAVALVAFVCAGLSWFSNVPQQLWYALLCVCMAGSFGIAYLSLRSATKRRTAVLQQRSASAPMWVFFAGVASALSLLVYADTIQIAFSAGFVALSCIFTVFLAWRVATMPALLTGDDSVVELFVDERLRRIRTGAVLTFTVIPQYVYASFSGWQTNEIHTIAWGFTLATWIAVSVYIFTSQRRSPSATEIASWRRTSPKRDSEMLSVASSPS